ncbi:hypothetical protein Cgig2_024401 [Carnegiea gigantea]|uniref:Uncharacterized protein n=1 Tax=Carnegiea gigantea TaxID=171969 RepID=A0A9Q1JFT8_9CARY|nr:hypothetical protein Cgig2_024401 [Carnegiea gigantea]
MMARYAAEVGEMAMMVWKWVGKAAATKQEAKEAREEDGQAQAGHCQVEEWGSERIKQKLEDIYQKMGCITVVECYSVMLGEYSVKLTNNRKLQRRTYGFITMSKGATHEVIYNQLVHPIEMHDIGKVDDKIGVVVNGEELDDDYKRCILPPNNGHHLGRPPSKQRESET